jgi:hypothetical protein
MRLGQAVGMGLSKLGGRHRDTPLNDVIPFWTRHAIDADGGIKSRIAADGGVVSGE